ncbi:hypothetical protein HU830_08185 [Lactobacillus sp. DCY120]|uniref:Competence protein ComGF n=1 Tax=Bombilactobacillus apium TaxID=2675299 RepID=A0A850REF9_9LACO|nr:hypothetical protein [Bombilactobacillus apium]NVY97098.1 hypothetical protein [Bombilactobacillus apium]
MKLVRVKITWNMIHKAKNSAFLLSELLVSLFILSLTVSLTLILARNYQQQKNGLWQETSSESTAMLQLEDMFRGAELKQVTSNDVAFVTSANYKYPRKLYHLNIYQDMLRVTGASEGHMPLLVHQKSLQIKLQQETVHLLVVDHLSRKWEYYFVFKKSS